MCGRYASAARSDDLSQMTGARDATGGMEASPNVAPTTDVAALVADPDAPGGRVLVAMRWGLVPHWSAGPGEGPLMINARVETAVEKAAFREPLRRRRCLVPAAGWYEWAPTGEAAEAASAPGRAARAVRAVRARRQPWLTRRRDGAPLLLAGVWTTWHGGADRLDSLAVLTRSAPDGLAWLHDRAPLLVPDALADAWLDPSCTEPSPLLERLLAAGDPGLVTHPVDPAVGDVRRQEAALTAPYAPSPGRTARQPSLF